MKRILLVCLPLMTAFISCFSLTGCCNYDSASLDVYTTYVSSEPSNLDPARGVDVNEGVVQSRIFDGLVRYNEKMELVPDLAESWTISEDGCQYTFKLRKNVTFHNGQKFTSADVAFSFDRILDPKTSSPRTWVLERIKGASDRMNGKSGFTEGIKVIDDYTICLTLSEPFAPFMSLLAMPACYILPSGLKDIEDKIAFFDSPSGTGPFYITERVRDSYIHMKANQSYFLGKPKVGNLLVRIITENLKAELEFESGSIDVVQLYPSNYNRFKENPEFSDKIADIPAMNVHYIGFNNQTAPFNNPKLRKALNYFIDREKIIKAIYSGRAVPAKGSIPPGISGYTSKDTGICFNPEKGLKMLAELGYNKSNPLKFDLYQKAQQSTFEVTRFIQGDMKKYGIEINIKPMEWSALKDAINKGEAPAFYMNWYGDYPDGENFLNPLFHSKNWGSGGNRAHFKDEEIDRLLEEAVKITDEKLRAEAYDRINRKVIDQAPWIYLWHCSESYLAGPRVEHIDFYPLFLNDNGMNISIKTNQKN